MKVLHVVDLRVVRRQIGATPEPEDAARTVRRYGLKETIVTVRRRRVGIARMQDDADAGREEAMREELRALRHDGGRQPLAAHDGNVHAALLEHGVVADDACDAPAPNAVIAALAAELPAVFAKAGAL